MNIQTITLSEMIVSGRHGATPPEQKTTQPFSVSAQLSFNAAIAITSEKLSSTINYYDIATLIHKEIEESSCTLLETLVYNTALRIAETFPVVSLNLSIQKMHIALRPKLSLQRSFFSERGGGAIIKSFEELNAEIIEKGIASTPFLSEKERATLLVLAEKQTYKKQPVAPEGSLVREDLSFCPVNKESELFRVVADRVVRFIYEMERAVGTRLIDQSLTNKEVSVQKYAADSFGITPHRDEINYHNLVVIVPLKGKGTLAVCDDREGSNPYKTDTTPGNLILLRAPGYAGMSVRPMHFVSDISEERIVMGIRFPR